MFEIDEDDFKSDEEQNIHTTNVNYETNTFKKEKSNKQKEKISRES